MPQKTYGAKTKIVDISGFFNFPQKKLLRDDWWKHQAEKILEYPTGRQTSWGIPFDLADGSGPRAICITKDDPEVSINIGSTADYLCILHNYHQLPDDRNFEDPQEGLIMAEYVLTYKDGTQHVQPVRARFEIGIAESLGPTWLVVNFAMNETVDPASPPPDQPWGSYQPGLRRYGRGPLLYAMPNPNPGKKIESLTIRCFKPSPLMISGLTLYSGSAHPLAHLPRRTYRINTGSQPAKITKAELDLGVVARIERTPGPCGKDWLESPFRGLVSDEPEKNNEDLIEAVGAPDATLSVTLEGQKKPLKFSLGEAFNSGKSEIGEARLEVLGRRRQWMHVKVIDESTGRPTPARVRICGSRGEYIAPYGHHSQVNGNWFEDYGADVKIRGRNYAYVPGEFTSDLPVGDLYVEICKGFEYEPVRTKVQIKPGQDTLELRIDRWKDLRSDGWVTADTHVHFISPHTAWLEAQAEGVNVVNLLASQWGRLFTNVGDITGRVGINENDTIVYVGTENRNHMLGHISMLGTQGLPVYPMCCGGPGESWVGDPEYMTITEWAMENKRKGGVVVRPHYPYCGHTEDPVAIIKGLIDALEIRLDDYAVQEWYRYLNNGYRVAVVGGTDKMSAATALGWMRTYAKLDPSKPFDYENWGEAVRAGRTTCTNGPLIHLNVEGQDIGGVIHIPEGGGTLHVEAIAECFAPIGRLDLVYNGCVIRREESDTGSKLFVIKDDIKIDGSGWIAARCRAVPESPGLYLAAHTSPVYIKCGETRAFDGPAMEHMLALVEGGMEYLQTMATVFDESSEKRMLKVYDEVRREIRERLVSEGQIPHHHGDGVYHTHGHGIIPDHGH